MSSDTAHLSIGEVLAELRDEFPDVTISKIRFLESQGLIDPERTPSGYRKFYDRDLTRLRWILHQQKEHFLPLKVIKERLDQLGPDDELPLDEPAAAPADQVDDADEPAAEPDAEHDQLALPASSDPPARAPMPTPPPAPTAVRPRVPTFVPTVPADDGDQSARRGAPPADEHYSRGELAAAAGLEPGNVEQLESFGLIRPAFEIGTEPRFDAEALEVASAAAGFFARGVEARHLRMYRTFAEREAVLFGQVLLPYVRQRNPEARARLQEELGELAVLGRRLRTALLRDAVRETLAE
jgi:DNA-binding transcriptional MerR regulator